MNETRTTKGKGAKAQAVRAYEPLDAKEIERRGNELADLIEQRFEALAHVLLEYESYEVVTDETERALDLLRNLKENRAYFKLRIGEVTAFLPRNQPLYAFCCFVIVPSLMASEVHFRIPHSMRHFFPKMLALLEVYERFPNVRVSNKERSEFLLERSALRTDPKSGETRPVTEAVIFTGNSVHADQLRLVFDQRTLFISNGSGHNPVVVAKDAKLAKAVDATLKLQLYNQGQDCAAPNAVLVHKAVFQEFLRLVRDELRTVKVGHYSNKECRVGPISDPKDLVRVQDFLIRHREWLDPTTPGIICSQDAILEPTIVAKPLSKGGNYSEIFAPVIFLQPYADDADLAQYFETPQYAHNAMYVTVYGTSKYLEKMVRSGKTKKAKVPHDRTTFLKNTHLHAPGKERGTEPYGGYGYGASSISIGGKVMPKPTLPQRDIFEWVAAPLLKKSRAELDADATRFAATTRKDVQKILKLKSMEDASRGGDRASIGTTYVDLEAMKEEGRRYARIEAESAYQLLETPNAKHIAKMPPADAKPVKELAKLLKKRPKIRVDELNTTLYALPVPDGAAGKEKRESQLRFFQNLYQLLLGTESGPRLAQFLVDIDRKKACELLDV